MKARSKAARIIRHVAMFPYAKPEEVALATGSTKNSVYTIRYRHKDEIDAKRLEILEEARSERDSNVLDLSAYPTIKEHIPEDQLKELTYSISLGVGKDRMRPTSTGTTKDRMRSGPVEQPQSVDALVDERAEKYGKFESLAEVSQRFKDSLHYFLITRNKYLAPDQQEAMELIFHKFARIINGDADYVDNWKDIAGYATLIADRLEGNAR